jgi:hypothetical protein
MMTTHRSRSGVVAALAAGAMLLSLAPAPGQADDESARTPPEEKTRPAEPEPRYQPPAEEPSPPKPSVGVLYVPPGVGFPGRRIGAGTRGMGRLASIQILAPDHLGYTTEEQPTLYWYLAEPTTLRIDFTIRDETSVEPLLEVELPRPVRTGVHAVRLADHGVRLRTGTRYLWFVSLVPEPDRRSRDFTVGAWITRREPDAALRRKLAEAKGREAFVCAEHGLWYDAIDVLSSRIEAAPGDGGSREQRAALLAQAGLSEVAAYDLSAVGR